MSNIPPLLQAEISITEKKNRKPLVNKVSFSLSTGESLGFLGQSGSGKTLTALALLGLLPKKELEVSGSILLEGKELLNNDSKSWQKIRGHKISMVFQNPSSALNPTMPIFKQFYEVLPKEKRSKKSVQECLQEASLFLSIDRLKDYPHNFSGGEKQRMMIAMSLACNPKILIADEPTTALDVCTQAETCSLLKSLQKKRGFALLFITHDLGLVHKLCDKVSLLYQGELVESGLLAQVMHNPVHPFTLSLLQSYPSLATKKPLPPYSGESSSFLSSGCTFTSSCPFAMQICAKENPHNPQKCWLYDSKAKKQKELFTKAIAEL